ncbi:hypothetical protein HY733_01980 [Candidatus Uhrbacteria bacterium]|nr:hypothetical protein [Candidatus Uhrbacteria bacterium]
MERTLGGTQKEKELIRHAEIVELQQTNRSELIRRYDVAVQDLARAAQDTARLMEIIHELETEMAHIIRLILEDPDDATLLKRTASANKKPIFRYMDAYSKALEDARGRFESSENTINQLRIVLDKKISDLGARPIAEA